MESVTKLRMNYHIHFAMMWVGTALTLASMGLAFNPYVPSPHVAIVNGLVALFWTIRMDRYTVNFKHRYRDELNKLSYRVWGDY